MHKIGSSLSNDVVRNVTMSIDFKSELHLTKSIGSVIIQCDNKELLNQLESAIKRAVNKFNKINR